MPRAYKFRREETRQDFLFGPIGSEKERVWTTYISLVKRTTYNKKFLGRSPGRAEPGILLKKMPIRVKRRNCADLIEKTEGREERQQKKTAGPCKGSVREGLWEPRSTMGEWRPGRVPSRRVTRGRGPNVAVFLIVSVSIGWLQLVGWEGPHSGLLRSPRGKLTPGVPLLSYC